MPENAIITLFLDMISPSRDILSDVAFGIRFNFLFVCAGEGDDIVAHFNGGGEKVHDKTVPLTAVLFYIWTMDIDTVETVGARKVLDSVVKLLGEPVDLVRPCLVPRWPPRKINIHSNTPRNVIDT